MEIQFVHKVASFRRFKLSDINPQETYSFTYYGLYNEKKAYSYLGSEIPFSKDFEVLPCDGELSIDKLAYYYNRI